LDLPGVAEGLEACGWRRVFPGPKNADHKGTEELKGRSEDESRSVGGREAPQGPNEGTRDHVAHAVRCGHKAHSPAPVLRPQENRRVRLLRNLLAGDVEPGAHEETQEPKHRGGRDGESHGRYGGEGVPRHEDRPVAESIGQSADRERRNGAHGIVEDVEGDGRRGAAERQQRPSHGLGRVEDQEGSGEVAAAEQEEADQKDAERPTQAAETGGRRGRGLRPRMGPFPHEEGDRKERQKARHHRDPYEVGRSDAAGEKEHR